ncbi:hypothetical protein MCOR27_010515 [Pyricularia oryzae]|uniref:Fork-head domain-containing protein n=2 Tax=Pyricularia TaxID=48558 RepID=A0ABQ8N416_PYRGI|nr:hypothetical protein MCOR01_000978 [Pyricularia oryzae]KAI6290875.1 hypothetical protein MCOR33_010997 [Pyricularia grisea]KAH9427207.1 hypothetical protein MCOR02_012332 [Pyricularia oryzae]KAI6252814.1 hypothetical protein MCOR19_010599 [Pyricularia oryzae]KAI6265235.1 hypothetical protein MCOR26_010847 [Pyricularia oryzae]
MTSPVNEPEGPSRPKSPRPDPHAPDEPAPLPVAMALNTTPAAEVNPESQDQTQGPKVEAKSDAAAAAAAAANPEPSVAMDSTAPEPPSEGRPQTPKPDPAAPPKSLVTSALPQTPAENAPQLPVPQPGTATSQYQTVADLQPFQANLLAAISQGEQALTGGMPTPMVGLNGAGDMGQTFIDWDLAAKNPDAMTSTMIAFHQIIMSSVTTASPAQLLMAMKNDGNQQSLNRAANIQPTINPSNVVLPIEQNGGASSLAVSNGGQMAGTQIAPSKGLESFARIEFADSIFQVTTYEVVIGRDYKAMVEQKKAEDRRAAHRERVLQAQREGLPEPEMEPEELFQPREKYSKSYVSEEGGMLGPASSESDNPDKPPRKRRKRARATGDRRGQSPLNNGTRGNSPANGKPLAPLPDRQYVEHTPGAAKVDLEKLKPSPHQRADVRIHSPRYSGTRSISREHLKIMFNPDKQVFEATCLGRNGFFYDDVFHTEMTTVVLRSGCMLQISDVSFQFFINGVKDGETGAEDYPEEQPLRPHSEGGKEMSFEFESAHGGDARSTTSESGDEEAQAQAAEPDSDDEPLSDLDEMDLDDAGDDDPAADVPMPTVEDDDTGGSGSAKLQVSVPDSSDIPKKRGPGRPPKNGIRSKREERLLRKAALEEAKKNAPPPVPGEPPIKRKVGRPRKNPLPEGAEDRPEKRKYKPRKPKNEDGEVSDGEKAAREKRKEKHKTPPLELKREDYTEEQLQKPNKNYSVLIDEVLMEAPPEGFTLKQVYKRIQMKYPWYYFEVDTKGWESSVRHNLIGNEAFYKDDHMWKRVPGVELDAGRKRKAGSPDQKIAAPSNMGGATQWTSQIPQQPQYHVAQGYSLGPSPTPGMQMGHGLPQTAQAPKQPLPPHQPAGVVNQHPMQQPSYQASSAYPQPPTPAPTQLPGYMQGNTTRQPQPGPQQAPYNPAFVNKPQSYAPAPVNQAASAAISAPQQQQHAQHQAPQQQRPQPVNYNQTQIQGVRGAHPGAMGSMNQNSGAQLGVNRAAMAAPPAAALPPLKPAIDPDVANFLKNFRIQVINQLEKKVPQAAELVAMSVINRGLGFSTVSIAPASVATVEKVIMTVFDTARQKYPTLADPKLIEKLTSFKKLGIDTLKGKLGEERSEALVLSAINRVLGLCDASFMQPANDTQKQEIEQAEGLLIKLAKNLVLEFQKEVAAASVGVVAGNGR